MTYALGSTIHFGNHEIDVDTVYLCNADGVAAWELTTGLPAGTWPARTISGIGDADNGYLIEKTPDHPFEALVISRQPGADDPRYPGFYGGNLSPSAKYLLGSAADTPSNEFRVIERETRMDVTADLGGDYYQGSAWWLDDDRYVVQTIPEGDDADSVEMLVCSISSGHCTVRASFDVEPGEFVLPRG